MASQKCQQIKGNGERCGVTFGLNPENGLCFHHDPKRAKDREAARRKGGHATGGHNRRGEITAPPSEVPPAPQSLRDAASWASWAVLAVTVGKVDVRIAREISGLLREFRSALKDGELTDEIEELRERFEEIKDRPELEAV